MKGKIWLLIYRLACK